MSFVGTRPEVQKFVDFYSSEMMATLLLPAGVTSEASILYKDEDRFQNHRWNGCEECQTGEGCQYFCGTFAGGSC